jgi:hypothetical protein
MDIYMNQPEPGVMDNLKNEIGNIGETIKNAGTTVSSKVGEIKANLQSVAENTKTTVDSAIKSSLPEGSPSFFALSDYTTMSSEFLESNSYIARFAFILLVVFAFFVLLKLATAVIKYFIGRSSGQVKIIDGMIDATKSQIIEQGIGSTKNIPRSKNQSSGIEFTWAVSLYIEDQPDSSTYSHIFSKGSTPTYTASHTGITTINQGPGLYLHNNSLIINMDMINTSIVIIEVPGVPHKKWLNVIIRCKNKIMDVYLNGQVAVSKQLDGIPKQNYGNVYVCNDGGFKGSLSNLVYYDHALTINGIQSLMTNSVNLQMLTPSTITNTGTDYMGFNWYTSK